MFDQCQNERINNLFITIASRELKTSHRLFGTRASLLSGTLNPTFDGTFLPMIFTINRNRKSFSAFGLRCSLKHEIPNYRHFHRMRN